METSAYVSILGFSTNLNGILGDFGRTAEEIFEPTFKVTHQAVGHVLVEILNTLRQLVSTQILTRQKVWRLFSADENTDRIMKTFESLTFNYSDKMEKSDLLARHVQNEGAALLMNLPSRLLEVFQEVHKVLGHLVRIEAGMATNGRTGCLALLGF